jgi:hypothetical protein
LNINHEGHKGQHKEHKEIFNQKPFVLREKPSCPSWLNGKRNNSQENTKKKTKKLVSFGFYRTPLFFRRDAALYRH